MQVVRRSAPDAEAQIRALLLLLRCGDATKSSLVAEVAHMDATSPWTHGQANRRAPLADCGLGGEGATK